MGEATSARDKDPLERVRVRATEAQRRQERQAAETPVQLFLPGMEEFMRAMPNPVARSSLFAPIARGRRKFHNETLLVSRSDVGMSYTGEQLDEADADIALQLVYEAQKAPLGAPVTINRAAFLRAMGRATGKTQYEWLHRRFKALTVATLFIEAKKPDGSTKYLIGKTEAFHILQSFRYDELTETYTFTLDPRWKILFGNREFALIDWPKRMEIGRGQDLAKALQRLVATSADPVQRYTLDWLKEKMQYGGRMRDFKHALIAATQELARLEIIEAGRIEDSTKGKEQLALWRTVDSGEA